MIYIKLLFIYWAVNKSLGRPKPLDLAARQLHNVMFPLASLGQADESNHAIY